MGVAMVPWGSDWRATAALIGIDVPAWKHGAFDYLESEGLRFCTHFGLDNAIDIAREHWRKRKDRTPLH